MSRSSSADHSWCRVKLLAHHDMCVAWLQSSAKHQCVRSIDMAPEPIAVLTVAPRSPRKAKAVPARTRPTEEVIPVAPSYALAKSIIRSQLDNVGAPFYTKISVNKFLSATNMLESKLHPGSHNVRSQSKICITKICIRLVSACCLEPNATQVLTSSATAWALV